MVFKAGSDFEISDYLFEIGDDCLVASYGYAIQSWYDGTEQLNEEGKTIALTKDLLNKTLTLNMIKIPIALERNLSAAGTVSYSENACIGTELSITASTKPGFTFLGWYDCEVLLTNNETYTFVLSTDDKTYTAKWDTSYVIPNGTTTIGYEQFKNWDFLTSITIPDSVTSIGYGAFHGCSSLESITIPFVGGSTNETNYRRYFFGYIFGTSYYEGGVATNTQGVGGVERYYIPSSLKTVVITGGSSINSFAFLGCTGLTSVTIGSSVTSIHSYAFYGCSSLISITIPDIVTDIGDYAFYDCSRLTGITIPDGVSSIGDYTFEGCSDLTSVTFGENSQLTIIGYRAFYNCSSLTSVTIGDNVTGIGSNAFSYCYKLAEVYNKSNLTITAGSIDNGYVGYYAKNVYTEEIGRELSTDTDGYIIYTDGADKILIGYTGTSTELTLPEGIAEINQYAFADCRSLTSITIPDSVTIIGEGAFEDCTSLTSVIFGEHSKLTEIGASAFYNCSSLTSITIPDKVTSVGSRAFYNCNSLTSICIPDGVTRIGSHAFDGCTSLTSVTIGSGVTSIAYRAFHNCSSLTSIIFKDTTTWYRMGSYGAQQTFVTNASTNATYFTSTYCDYIWYKK